MIRIETSDERTRTTWWPLLTAPSAGRLRLRCARLEGRTRGEGKRAPAPAIMMPCAYQLGRARSAAEGVPPQAQLERCTRALHGDRTKAGYRRTGSESLGVAGPNVDHVSRDQSPSNTRSASLIASRLGDAFFGYFLSLGQKVTRRLRRRNSRACQAQQPNPTPITLKKTPKSRQQQPAQPNSDCAGCCPPLRHFPPPAPATSGTWPVRQSHEN